MNSSLPVSFKASITSHFLTCEVTFHAFNFEGTQFMPEVDEAKKLPPISHDEHFHINKTEQKE